MQSGAMINEPEDAHSYDVADYGAYDTGFSFGDIVSSVADVVTAPAKAAVSVVKSAEQAGESAVKSIAHFASDAANKVEQAANSVVKTATSLPILKQIADAHKLALQGYTILQKSPIWQIAQTGVSFIPGVGQAVSGGMAAAAALGKGKSLRDAAIAAAKNALPGGPITAAAFDVATGLLDGKSPGEAVLAAVREQVPGGALGKAAFDAARAIAEGHGLDNAALDAFKAGLANDPQAVNVFNQALLKWRQGRAIAESVPFHGAIPQVNAIANAVHNMPSLRFLSVPQLATHTGQSIPDVKQTVAAFLNRFRGQDAYDWRDVGDMDSIEQAAARHGVNCCWGNDTAAAPAPLLPRPVIVGVSRGMLQQMYKTGHSTLQKAMLAHGFLSRIAHHTGELNASGGWTVKSGDTLSKIAKTLTGDANRYMEMYNLNKAAIGSNPNVIRVGAVFKVPPSWMGTATPAPTPAPAAAQVVATSGGVYVVKSGDTLSKIAQALTGNANRWTEMYALNKATIGANPDVIRVGMSLVIPPTWTATGPAIPAVSATTPAGADALTTAGIELLLASFFQRHGAELGAIPGAPVAPVFGTVPEDLAGAWNDRTRSAMQAFQIWKNSHGATTPLPTDGSPDQASILALRQQVSSDLSAVTGVQVPIPNIPINIPIPPPASSPGIVPPITLPTLPPPSTVPISASTTTSATVPAGGAPGSASTATTVTGPLGTVQVTGATKPPVQAAAASGIDIALLIGGGVFLVALTAGGVREHRRIHKAA